jgi:hypothetical protein
MALEGTFHRFTGLQLIVAQTISSVKEGSTGLTYTGIINAPQYWRQTERPRRCNMRLAAARQAENPINTASSSQLSAKLNYYLVALHDSLEPRTH